MVEDRENPEAHMWKIIGYLQESIMGRGSKQVHRFDKKVSVDKQISP